MVQSSIRGFPPATQVCELIDEDKQWWNIPLIQYIFNVAGATMICSLPLSLHGQPDRLMWSGSSTGVFSVRSAYHLGKEQILRASGESSKASQSRRVWQRIRTLQVPGMVKNFIWRVCSNSLPTRANLFKRGITSDALCPIYGLFPETLIHILWSCNSAVAVLMECKKKIQKLSFVAYDGFDLFERFMAFLEDDNSIL